jgi:hypothetical protein
LIPTGLHAREPQIKVEQVLQATQSWDGRPYTSYPAGQPQVTVLRIAIPPNTALHWHRHFKKVGQMLPFAVFDTAFSSHALHRSCYSAWHSRATTAARHALG